MLSNLYMTKLDINTFTQPICGQLKPTLVVRILLYRNYYNTRGFPGCNYMKEMFSFAVMTVPNPKQASL